MRKHNIILLLLMVMLSVSCQWTDVDEANLKHNGESNGSSVVVTDTLRPIKVAVVLPMDASYGPRFQMLYQWAQELVTSATSGISYSVAPLDVSGIDIDVEWYDENTVDIQSTASQLANDEEIAAILGPMFSSDAYLFALECAKTGKNLFLPCTTSSEVVRKFSDRKWFWSFSETDIRQCQIMLDVAKNQFDATGISLITSTSYYGQTFSNWLPFEAKEAGVKYNKTYTYSSDFLDSETAEKVLNNAVDGEVIVCAPGEVSDLLTMQKAVNDINPNCTVLYSDIASDPSLLDYSSMFQDAYGIGIYPDGETDFSDNYWNRMLSSPTEGECQFFDALILMAVTAADLYDNGYYIPSDVTAATGSYNSTVSDALSRILKPGDFDELFLTSAEDVRTIVNTKLYNLRGASGHIDFDKDNNCSVAHSTYQLWTIRDKAFNPVEIYQEAEMSEDAWLSMAGNIDEVQTSDVSVVYPATDENWALLVAGSTGWSDYRHQANVLKMYNMLKSKGYADDHIVLVMEGNLFYDSQNPNQGYLLDYNGKYMSNSSTIDYKPSELTASDIISILTGNQTSALQQVIGADSDDNIFVYWTGNGEDGEFDLGGSSFTAADFKSLVSSLSSSKSFRKMLWLSDVSHAQSVTSLDESQGVTGILCINSSESVETAIGDQCLFDEDINAFISTHFSIALLNEFTSLPYVNYYQLYEDLASATMGSHVNVSNALNYSNLKTTSFGEMIN